MAIRYKVVTPNYRSCSCVDNGRIYALGDAVRTYLPNTIVTAQENTLGLFVFERLKDAERYIEGDNLNCLFHNCKIMRIETIGRGKRVSKVLRIWNGISKLKNYSAKDILGMDLYSNGFLLEPSPKGTLTYKSIKVLNEVSNHAKKG